jgi:hypothetical protein
LSVDQAELEFSPSKEITTNYGGCRDNGKTLVWWRWTRVVELLDARKMHARSQPTVSRVAGSGRRLRKSGDCDGQIVDG